MVLLVWYILHSSTKPIPKKALKAYNSKLENTYLLHAVQENGDGDFLEIWMNESELELVE